MNTFRRQTYLLAFINFSAAKHFRQQHYLVAKTIAGLQSPTKWPTKIPSHQMSMATKICTLGDYVVVAKCAFPNRELTNLVFVTPAGDALRTSFKKTHRYHIVFFFVACVQLRFEDLI